MMDFRHGQLLRVPEVERQLELLARLKARTTSPPNRPIICASDEAPSAPSATRTFPLDATDSLRWDNRMQPTVKGSRVAAQLHTSAAPAPRAAGKSWLALDQGLEAVASMRAYAA